MSTLNWEMRDYLHWVVDFDWIGGKVRLLKTDYETFSSNLYETTNFFCFRSISHHFRHALYWCKPGR